MAGPDRIEPWLRLAGVEALEEGSLRTWSVAEGTRGRRWRETRLDRERRLVSTMALETGPDGSFARLELTTDSGMLTLHPDTDGRSAHGNVVMPTGMRHLALPWGPDRRLLVLGSRLSARMLVAGIAPGDGAGAPEEPARVSALVVPDELDLREAVVSVVRADRGWSILVAGVAIEVEEASIPALPFAGTGATWPLEEG
jgi:hypothetical protein